MDFFGDFGLRQQRHKSISFTRWYNGTTVMRSR